MDSIPLLQIGVVHSTVKEPGEMPPEEIAAEVEIFPQFRPALEAVEENSHLIILAWLHKANRDTLRADGRSGMRCIATALRSPCACSPATQRRQRSKPGVSGSARRSSTVRP